MRLAGKRAYITGAGAGIGATGAKLFAREGAAVMVADIDLAAAETVAGEIEAAGGRALAQRCDVLSEDEIHASVDAAAAEFGGLDIVWANAGGLCDGRATDTEMDQWQRMLALNLTSAWLTAKYGIPHLVVAGGGSLIFTSSMCSVRGPRNVFAYAAAKGGVNSMARQIAMDYADQKIRANVIMPGTSRTQLTLDTYAARARELGVPAEELLAQMEAGFPLGRLGEVEDHANAALFFASDESAWLTGHFLAVDGGRFAKW